MLFLNSLTIHLLYKFSRVEIEKLVLTFQLLNLALWVKCLRPMAEAEHSGRSGHSLAR